MQPNPTMQIGCTELNVSKQSSGNTLPSSGADTGDSLMDASRWEYWSYETLFKCMGSLGGSVVKNLPANAGDSGDVGLIPE